DDDSLDPLARFEAAVLAYLTFFDDRPEMAELFIQERAHFRDRHRPLYFDMKRADESSGKKTAFLQALIAAGKILALPPHLLRPPCRPPACGGARVAAPLFRHPPPRRGGPPRRPGPAHSRRRLTRPPPRPRAQGRREPPGFARGPRPPVPVDPSRRIRPLLRR